MEICATTTSMPVGDMHQLACSRPSVPSCRSSSDRSGIQVVLGLTRSFPPWICSTTQRRVSYLGPWICLFSG
ncbi:hypothetical protein LWI29_008462 [Acer saccharum]|uniref:Uncharacterized protein n=1 Tax=Acer saccharum TaxID=4024 RepID=A0AA39SF41_ACESA|nr:hypothetical protein LWI29_008462 [Acer saccharum]